MSKEKITFLIENLSEGLDVEVKNWLNGLMSNEDKSTLAKEIIALANSGGGLIFIGFNDQGDQFVEIQPQDGEFDAFTQDSIANVVKKYVSPPCQCYVSYHQQKDSTIKHPVISVPGDHRTPVWAKHGGPDNKNLQSETVYVRRPGGASERAKTQDDWEKLLDRLVKARQNESLNAMRDVLNPPKRIIQPEERLDKWDNKCLNFWTDKVKVLPNSDARRNEKGYWTVSFVIENFNRPHLTTIKRKLANETPIYSASPPFAVVPYGPRSPTARGDEIEAWLAHNQSVSKLVSEDDSADYWRLSNRGKGFSLKPMLEDSASYLSNEYPKLKGPYFDWIFPIYRMTEILKFVESLATHFADRNSRFSLLVKYYKTNGRRLVYQNYRLTLPEGIECSQSQLESRMSSVVSQINITLEETVYTLLRPIYETVQLYGTSKGIGQLRCA